MEENLVEALNELSRRESILKGLGEITNEKEQITGNDFLKLICCHK